jgi:hypothetical protein
MPDSIKHRLAFHFHLRFSNTLNNGQTEDLNDFQGVKLERYVLHTVQDDLVSFNIHVPQEGDYFIEIFASLVVNDQQIVLFFTLKIFHFSRSPIPILSDKVLS